MVSFIVNVHKLTKCCGKKGVKVSLKACILLNKHLNIFYVLFLIQKYPCSESYN